MSKRTRSKTKNPNPTRARRAHARRIRQRALLYAGHYIADLQRNHVTRSNAIRDIAPMRTAHFRGLLPYMRGQITRKMNKRAAELDRHQLRKARQFGAQHGRW